MEKNKSTGMKFGDVTDDLPSGERYRRYGKLHHV